MANTIDLLLRAKMDLSQVQNQVSNLKGIFDKLDLGKGLTSTLSTSFKEIESAMGKYSSLLEKGISGKNQAKDLDAIAKAGREVDNIFSTLIRNFEKIGQGDIAKSLGNFSESFKKLQSDIASAEKNIEQLSAGPLKALENAFNAKGISGSKGYIDSLKQLKEAFNSGDFSNINQYLDATTRSYDQLMTSLSNKKGDADREISKITQSLKELGAASDALTSTKSGKSTLGDKINNLTSLNFGSRGKSFAEKFSGFSGSKSDNKLVSDIQTVLNGGGTYNQVTSLITNIEKLKASLASGGDANSGLLAFLNRSFNSSTTEGYANQINNIKVAYEGVKAVLTNNSGAFEGNKNMITQLLGGGDNFNAQNVVAAYNKMIEVINQKREELASKLNAPQANSAELEQQIKGLEAAQQQLNAAFGDLSGLQLAIDTLQKLSNEAEGETKKSLEDVINLLTQVNREAGESSKNLQNGLGPVNNAAQQMSAQQRQVEQVFYQFTRYTSLYGIFNTITKAVRTAFSAVKDLDAAMNSIAVVTDMTTSDLWGQIDAYTNLATSTGATIKGAYEVAQLYYQQGLSTNEVMTMTSETLKFARISGLDYAAATDYMTAALKGFNLEAENVTHVNDVYSNLAAHTASSTEEISIAMSKVASIAHNTGMELETTAGFLAQIIATTRESPETAGTALKTVIARFAEVKKLVSQGEDSGTTDEGDEVSVNKIEDALKVAGVALRDQTGQMRDLDDVFIELASKWEGLDTMTQRYIATQAAGSRQQSRFLALMQNYDDLMNTLGYAEDAEGASAEQFGKTLDSLETKMNNLSNAWTAFTTGITDSTMIKGAVDGLTTVVNIINKITGGLGKLGGPLAGPFAKILTLFGGLRLAGGAMGSLLEKRGMDISKMGLQNFGQTWNSGIINGIKSGISGFKGQGPRVYNLLDKNTKALKATGTLEQLRDNGHITGQEFTKLSQQANLAAVTIDSGMVRATRSVKGLKGAFASMNILSKISLAITAITVLVGVISAVAKAIKTTKERAEEFQKQLESITDTRKELNDMASTLNNLTGYKEGVEDNNGNIVFSNFSALIEGVDKYGQNVSLSSENYNRYLEICDDIIALNPDLAKGYKSNAEAIAAQSGALDELIKKQKENLRITALEASVKFSSEEGYQNAIANYKTQRDAYNTATAYLDFINDTGNVLGEKLEQTNWGFADPDTALTPSKLSPLLAKLLADSSKNNYVGFTQELKKNWGAIQKQIEGNELFEHVNRTTYDSWVVSIGKEFDALDLKISEANDNIELTKKAFEESKKALHDQYMTLAMASEGWYNLSDAQQKVVENTIKYSGKFDITEDNLDPQAYVSKRADIENQIRALTELDDSKYMGTTTVGNWGELTIKQIIESLRSDEFTKLGYDQGQDYINSFYQAIKGIADGNEDLQAIILQALGLNGMDWDTFMGLEASGFGKAMYGDKANGDLAPYERLQAMFNNKIRSSDPRRARGAQLDLFTGLSPELLDFITSKPDLVQQLAENYGAGLISTTEEFTQAVQDAYNDVIKSNPYLANRQDNLEWGHEQEGYEQWAIQQATTGGQPEQTVEVEKGKTQAYGTLDEQDQGAKSLEELSAATLQLTRNAWEAIDSQEGLQEAVSNNIKTYKDAKSSGKSYAKQIGAMTKAAQEMFGTYIDADFVEENIDLFEDYANGVEGAEEALREAAGKEYFESLGDVGEQTTIAKMAGDAASFRDVLDTLNGANIAVGATFDATDLLSGIQMSEAQAQQLAEYLASQGWIVTWTRGEEVPNQPGLYNWSADVINVNGLGNTGGGGGGGGGGGKEPAKPKQDPFYNYIKNNEQLERSVKNVQHELDFAYDSQIKFNKLRDQEKAYSAQMGGYQSYLNAVGTAIEKMQAKLEKKKFSKYFKLEDDGTLNLLDKYWKSTGDITETLDEMIEEYDDLLGRQEEMEDAIRDLEKSYKDLWDQYRDGAIETINTIAETLQASDEKELEDREKMYEEMEEQDERYLDSVRKNIEEERRLRDRANDFEDLEKKQNRLALLQRDTSGRYANDIAELQKEINDSQQQLADDNIDHILDQLDKQLEDNQQMHEDTIEKMQEIIDDNVENRVYIQEAQDIMAQGFDAITNYLENNNQDYLQASDPERNQMLEDWNNNMANSAMWFEKMAEGMDTFDKYLADMVEDNEIYQKMSSVIEYLGKINESIITLQAQQNARGGENMEVRRYAQGGLVNYTGPAWVDGSTSQPEAFLNPAQTKLIGDFANLLQRMAPSSESLFSTTTNGGLCEINIDIGSLGADYDIDLAIQKVKQEIIDSSQFRNVTLLNRKR